MSYGQSRRARRILLQGAVVILLGLVVVLSIAGCLTGSDPLSPTGQRAAVRPTVESLASQPGGLALSIASSQPQICLNDSSGCAAGVGDSLVRLTATANASSSGAWAAVQVVFVLETTPYDGVYDPTAGVPGNDTCAVSDPGSSLVCEESNSVPFFVANAGAVASAIAGAHPGTRFTFGLVDYFATHDAWDDGDGFQYHVDVGTPVPASEFGADVSASISGSGLIDGAYLAGSDLADNFLHSSSITALYGTLSGAGIGWASDTHHVIVWIGSTAPQDPNYPENYCVSPTAYVPNNATCTSSIAVNYTAPTCEPSYSFAAGGIASPRCEGWVQSQDAVAGDSIAGLARTAPTCSGSLGGNCTVDAIDAWTLTTDAYSIDWPHRSGGGPGSNPVAADASSILDAGCDLAVATGGTWDGPGDYTCANGDTGTLKYVQHGPYSAPNTTNPTLQAALTEIGLGAPPLSVSAFGGSGSMFAFATTGNVEIDPDFSPDATCQNVSGTPTTCQHIPSIVHVGGRSVLEWNWSTDPNSNALYQGDTWTALIQVMATGPPFGVPVPIDACETTQCVQNGSVPAGGFYTSAMYLQPGSASPVSRSFPLARVTVVLEGPGSGSSSSPPPAPGAGIPPPVLAPTPIVTPTPAPVVAPSAVASGLVSIQATAAGFLAAGFARITLRPRKVSMRVAVKGQVPNRKSLFDNGAQTSSERAVHFE